MTAAYEQRAVDTTFAHLGQPISYTPTVGEAITIVGLLTRPDAEIGIAGSRLVLEDIALEVRAADIVQPVADDQFTANGITYQVTGEPMMDEAGLVWTCDGRRIVGGV